MAKRKSSDPVGDILVSFFGGGDSTKKGGRKTPSKLERGDLYVRQRGRCMYCGKKLEINYLNVEHKVPTARGGKDTRANKQLTCMPCNNRKGTMTDGEFRKRYTFLQPAMKAKEPPTKVIPQSKFVDFDKELNARSKAKAKAEKGEKDGGVKKRGKSNKDDSWFSFRL